MNIVLRALGNKGNLLSVEQIKLNNKKKFVIMFNFSDESRILGQEVCNIYYINFKKLRNKINKCEVEYIIFQGKFYFESEYAAAIAINKIKDDFAATLEPYREMDILFDRFMNRTESHLEIDTDLDGAVSTSTIMNAMSRIGFTNAHSTAYAATAAISTMIREMAESSLEAAQPYQYEASRHRTHPISIPSQRGIRAGAIMVDDAYLNYHASQLLGGLRREE